MRGPACLEAEAGVEGFVVAFPHMAKKSGLEKSAELAAKMRARREAEREPHMSREELQQKADDLDRERERFEKLDDAAKLEEAQKAGYMTAEEYTRKRGLRKDDPNLYRLRLQAMGPR